jgi:hypothetical protein
MWFDLKGDERLGRCASEGCGGQPTFRLEASGVGSNYCSGCRAKIEGTFKAGDDVRDRAQLGGQVTLSLGDRIRVRWNNGQIGWIDARFLTHADSSTAHPDGEKA